MGYWKKILCRRLHHENQDDEHRDDPAPHRDHDDGAFFGPLRFVRGRGRTLLTAVLLIFIHNRIASRAMFVRDY